MCAESKELIIGIDNAFFIFQNGNSMFSGSLRLSLLDQESSKSNNQNDT